MKSTQLLKDLGQSLWLDTITRDMLNDGTLERYRDELSITGLTSNPTIFEEAIGKGHAYDDQLRSLGELGLTGEQLFAELAISDLKRAADLFRPIFDNTAGLDGWVSMEVSPLLIRDALATALAAHEIHSAAKRPNLFVKIPGSEEGISAIEETLFAGIPVNVTLLFSTEHYIAAANAHMRAMERRIAAGLEPDVMSVASMFVSRWDMAVTKLAPTHLRYKLGIAVAQQTYRAFWDIHNSRRWQKLEAQGARSQRLLWASTGNKDPLAPADLYVRGLAVPRTINTMPKKTLLAFANDPAGADLLPPAADPEPVLAEFKRAGIDVDSLASRLQEEGGRAFVKSWHSLIEGISRQREMEAS